MGWFVQVVGGKDIAGISKQCAEQCIVTLGTKRDSLLGTSLNTFRTTLCDCAIQPIVQPTFNIKSSTVLE